MKYIFIKEYIYNFNMSTNSYSFVKVTQLPDVAVDGNIQNLSYIGNNSYMLLSYNGDSYKVSTQKFIDIINQHVKRLNDKLDSLITNSSAQPREYDTNVPQEKYIYTYYVTNSYDDERIEEYGEGEELNFTHKKFTILSYGLYSEINTYNHEGESANSEYYTYSLSNGLVTGELLNTYMSYSLDTLLGTPGTLTYVSEAIDSIYEFANWFEGVKRDSSYNALMTYVTNSDYEIIVGYTNAINELINKINELIDSYTSADNEILNFCNSANLEIVRSYTTADMILGNRIDSLSTTINNVSNNVNNLSNDINNLSNNKQETLISGTNIKTINNQSLLGSGNITIQGGSGGTANYNPGNNISINDDTINCYIGVNSTENKSFTISGKKYSLQFANGEFYINEMINPYTAFTFTSQSGTSSSETFEIDQKPSGGSISIVGKGNKEYEITELSNVNGQNLNVGTTINAGANIIVTGTYSSNTNKTFKISVLEHLTQAEQEFGGNVAQIKNLSVSITFKYKIWTFTSPNNVTLSVDSNNYPNLTSFNNVNGAFTNLSVNAISKTINIGNANEYIYLLIPVDCVSDAYGFFVGSAFPETESYTTINLYSTNKSYRLYKSNAAQTGIINYQYKSRT